MSKFSVGAGMANLDYPLEKYPAMTFSVVCAEKYDDCNCRAICIDDGNMKLLLLAFELSDIPEVPDLEEKISAATGVPAQDVIITVTHNHTSPCDRGARMGGTDESRAKFREEFFEIELNAAIKAATDAVQSLRPAKYGYGEINSYIVQNEITRNPKIGFLADENGNGYIDPTLSIIEFIDYDDKPICFLMNHPSHATMAMGPNERGNFTTSGNFTGIACRFVEDYFGNDTVALWTPGASGNLHPIYQNYNEFAYTDGYSVQHKLPDGFEHLMMEFLGRNHGVDAVNCINGISEFKDDLTLKHTKGSISLPNQRRVKEEARPPFDPDARFRNIYGDGVRSNQDHPAEPFTAPEMVIDYDHPSTLKMEVAMIGDVAYVLLGCELFCQIGRDIKNALPAKHTVVVTHIPGYVGDNPHAIGYIVDKSSIGSTNSKLYRNLIPGGYDDMIVEEAQKLYVEAND